MSTLHKIPASFYENKFHVVRIHVRVLSERENDGLVQCTQNYLKVPRFTLPDEIKRDEGSCN